ncbi:MAG: hypothetical protein EXR72_04370 [Myxococcales bacterium]|nr:hypothetical protein [Myxococcales bacterium]
MKQRRARRIALGLLAPMIVAAVWAVLIEPDRLVVKHARIAVAGAPPWGHPPVPGGAQALRAGGPGRGGGGEPPDLYLLEVCTEVTCKLPGTTCFDDGNCRDERRDDLPPFVPDAGLPDFSAPGKDAAADLSGFS